MRHVKTMAGGNVQVEVLRTPQEMTVLEDLQREIWGYGEPGADPPYPARALLALAESGGLVALARVDSQPAGFSVAWIGRWTDQQFYFHSQLVGVRPQFRRSGIAYALKLQQREYALDHGLRIIRWTFDPLRAANARLNLTRLAAVCRTFRANYYGPLGSRFSAGDESDRLWAEWHLLSPRTLAALSGKPPAPPTPATPVITTETVETPTGRFRAPTGWIQPPPAAAPLAEIPADWDLLRACRPDLAARWRHTVRAVLEHYLESGFTVTGLAPGPDPDSGPAYVLELSPLAEVLERCG
jgi:predicted GNAT superfamily acetyltransferase